MKVLIIQQKMIGDVLTSSILLEAIRTRYPKSELHYLINSHTHPVIQNNPHPNKILLFEAKHKQLKHLISLGKALKREKYDVVIDVYAKLSSLILTRISKSKLRIGYRKYYTALFYNQPITREKTPNHNTSLAIENRMKLLEPLDIEFYPANPQIYLTEDEKQNAQFFLKKNGINLKKPTYMISVLGSGPQKTYPAKYMAECLDVISEASSSAQILFNYIPNQKKEAYNIYQLCNKQTQQKIYFDVYGKSLREFLAITHNCNALIGNEGGAVNMAKAMNIPTFTIFNPLLTKKSWFGKSETKRHVAVHLGDFYDLTNEKNLSKPEDTKRLYLKLKPKYFKDDLLKFLKNIGQD